MELFSADASDTSRYRALLEAAPDAMVVVNQSGVIELLNLQAEYQFGYPRDELVGQHVTNIIPVGFAERLLADSTRTAAAAEAQQIGTGLELTGRRKDGTEFPIEIMLSPVESADGILVTAAIRNISVRRAAEAHLVQMESRYRALLEAAPDAMVVVNQSGAIELLNVQAEHQFNYPRDELVGQNVTNIIPAGFAERLLADSTRTAAAALAQQIGTGLELTGRRKDGTEFPIEIMLSPVESANGILVTAAIRNISVRRAAEAHLVQMESRYRALLEAAPDAMVVVDQRGAIELLNVQAEYQFGYPRDELVGQHVTNIIPAGFAERLLADSTRTAAAALAQQIGTGLELTGRRKDGTEFPIEIMLSPVESADGILVTAAIRNISVRRAAEAHLRQMESGIIKLKEEFLSHVSHELRSPLTAIYQFVTILLDGLSGELNVQQHEHLSIVLKNVAQLRAMIDDLLELTRVQTGKLVIQPENMSMTEAIAYAIKTLQGAAAGKHIRLSANLGNRLPLVYADPTRIRQVLITLLDNAIKFTPANGSVIVHASVSDANAGFVTLEVSDSGCGIPIHLTELIFDRQFQADPSVEGRRGLGLGLYICKELVTRQGGRVWATNLPERGTVFTVTVPVVVLPDLIEPLLLKEAPPAESVGLIRIESRAETGWPSNDARAEWSLQSRTIIQTCLFRTSDKLLPHADSGGPTERSYVIAFGTDKGVAVLADRIRDRLTESGFCEHRSLTVVVSYQCLQTTGTNDETRLEGSGGTTATRIAAMINSDLG